MPAQLPKYTAANAATTARAGASILPWPTDEPYPSYHPAYAQPRAVAAATVAAAINDGTRTAREAAAAAADGACFVAWPADEDFYGLDRYALSGGEKGATTQGKKGPAAMARGKGD